MRSSPLILAVLALAAAGSAAAAPVAIPVGHAARLQINGQAGSVVVGDPAVADAIAIDPHTIYVQGKAYGQTEILVLDKAGRTIWQGDVAVVSGASGRVTVVRGGQAQGVQTVEMTCADVCSPVTPAKPK